MGYFAASTNDGVNPIEDFSLPPDCTTSDCATISGKVKDKATGKPVAGVTVAIPGLDSGFASDLADTTDSAGHFSIANVPVHTYHLFSIRGAGYEPLLVGNLPVTGDLVAQREADPRLGVDRGRSQGRQVHAARLRPVRVWPRTVEST